MLSLDESQTLLCPLIHSSGKGTYRFTVFINNTNNRPKLISSVVSCPDKMFLSILKRVHCVLVYYSIIDYEPCSGVKILFFIVLMKHISFYGITGKIYNYHID